MKIIKHPNIVSLIEDFENEKYIYLVMEYYKGGDLFSYINEYYKKCKEHLLAKIGKLPGICDSFKQIKPPQPFLPQLLFSALLTLKRLQP